MRMGRDQEQMKKDPCIINSKTKVTKKANFIQEKRKLLFYHDKIPNKTP